MNSLIGVAEGLMPLIYAPMYTQVYKATLEVLPGAFYLLGGALTLPAVFIFLWEFLLNIFIKKSILLIKFIIFRWLYKLQKNEDVTIKDQKIPEAAAFLSQSLTELKEISRVWDWNK